MRVNLGKRSLSLVLVFVIFFGFFTPLSTSEAAGAEKGIVSGSKISKVDDRGNVIASKELKVGDSYKLVEEQAGYNTASDAANAVNSTGKRSVGNYYIYKIYDGMYNLSAYKSTPGAWVNLADSSNILAQSGFVSVENTVEEEKPAPVNTGTFKGFTTATRLNVRSSINGPVVNTLLDGSYVEGTYSESGYWIKISLFGKTRYIAAKYTEPIQKKGWVNKGNYRYYIRYRTGLPIKGFAYMNGNRYYFDPMMRYMYRNGVKSTGRSLYYFNSSGVLTSGKRTIYGTTHNQTFNFGKPGTTERSNGYLSKDERDYLGQHAVNTALKAIGTKYYWYGTSLRNGTYCSGLAYRAYIDNGVKIPGPEYGNEARAKELGPQSGPTYRGWGPVGDYGYRMVNAQYNKTDDYTGGTRARHYGNFSNLLPGDLFFARNPEMTHLVATHTAIYAGRLNGVHYTMHSGFAGNRLEPISAITSGWGYTLKAYYQRSFK